MTTHDRPGWARRFGAAGAALVLVLSACGSSGTDVETETVAGAVDDDPGAPATTVPLATDADDDSAASTDGALADDQPGMVDEHPALEAGGTDPAEAGTSDEESEPPGDATGTAPAEAARPESPQVAVELPSLPVVDLISGETVDLSSVPAPGPTLVWFWAPH